MALDLAVVARAEETLVAGKRLGTGKIRHSPAGVIPRETVIVIRAAKGLRIAEAGTTGLLVSLLDKSSRHSPRYLFDILWSHL